MFVLLFPKKNEKNPYHSRTSFATTGDKLKPMGVKSTPKDASS